MGESWAGTFLQTDPEEEVVLDWPHFEEATK